MNYHAINLSQRPCSSNVIIWTNTLDWLLYVDH